MNKTYPEIYVVFAGEVKGSLSLKKLTPKEDEAFSYAKELEATNTLVAIAHAVKGKEQADTIYSNFDLEG
jgi:hypothetical protein